MSFTAQLPIEDRRAFERASAQSRVLKGSRRRSRGGDRQDVIAFFWNAAVTGRRDLGEEGHVLPAASRAY